MAQEKPTIMPRGAVNGTIKRFKLAFCSDVVPKMTAAILDCYASINFDVTNPVYEQCLVADFTLSMTLNSNRKDALKEGKPDPYPELSPLFAVNASKNRLKKFFGLLRSRGYTPAESAAYFIGPEKEFLNFVTNLCD